MMDIERINENTIKFFLSNQDMESRGFALDELWQDRSRGEQFLWRMLDEVQEEIDIQFEGALKIQVNVSDQGLEFIITNSPEEMAERLEQIVQMAERLEQITHFLARHTDEMICQIELPMVAGTLNRTQSFAFAEFEDVITLFKNAFTQELTCQLYSYQDVYYLMVHYTESEIETEESVVTSSRILEYSEQAIIPNEMIQEYGKLVIDKNVFETINSYF